MLRRRVEAAKLREDAAANRRDAQLELEAADELDSQAARLAGRQGALESETNHIDGDISENSPVAALTGGCAKSKRAATIANGAVAQLQEDIIKLRGQAVEKRRKAEYLQREATTLEQTAAAELNPAPHLTSD